MVAFSLLPVPFIYLFICHFDLARALVVYFQFSGFNNTFRSVLHLSVFLHSIDIFCPFRDSIIYRTIMSMTQ